MSRPLGAGTRPRERLLDGPAASYGVDVAGALTLTPDPVRLKRDPEPLIPATEDDIAGRVATLRREAQRGSTSVSVHAYLSQVSRRSSLWLDWVRRGSGPRSRGPRPTSSNRPRRRTRRSKRSEVLPSTWRGHSVSPPRGPRFRHFTVRRRSSSRVGIAPVKRVSTRKISAR